MQNNLFNTIKDNIDKKVVVSLSLKKQKKCKVNRFRSYYSNAENTDTFNVVAYDEETFDFIHRNTYSVTGRFGSTVPKIRHSKCYMLAWF